MSMLVGAASVIGGGFLVDYLGKRYFDGHLRSLLTGLLLIMPGFGLFALMPTPELSIALLVPALIGNGILQASGVTALMAVAPTQMKSQLAALNFFVINLIGAALGPTLIAVLTDRVFADEVMLRYSISIVALIVGGLAIWAVLFGRRAYRDLKVGAAQ
jgi:MFS family permease